MKLFGRQFQGKRFDGTLEEYLQARYDLDPKTECWVWKMSLAGGYGYFLWQGKWTYAHRAAWETWRGPIPDELQVLHTCDNMRCYNPDHLWLGTQKDNLRDMVAKGRHWRMQDAQRAGLA